MTRRALALALLAACQGGSKGGGPPAADAGPHRLRKHDAGHIRAYPPHAIRADGLGPYRLDETLNDVWEEVPEEKNLEVLELGRYASWGVVHREAGQILIGVDSTRRVAFMGVLARDVARTASGVGVGATGAELAAALGKPRAHPQVVRDRLVYEFDALPHVRFVTDAPVGTPPERAQVAAVVIARDEGSDRPDGGARSAAGACRAGGPLAGAAAEIGELARGKAAPGGAGASPAPAAPAVPTVEGYGCVTGAAPEAVVLGPGGLELYGGEPGHLRRTAAAPQVSAEFAGPIDVDGDGRDEILYGLHHRGDHERAVEVHLLRWEGGRLVETMSSRPIVVGDAAAALAGQIPPQVDFVIEARPGSPGSLEIGGLYLGRTPARALRAIAPLSPVVVREARGPSSTTTAEGPADAGGRNPPP